MSKDDKFVLETASGPKMVKVSRQEDSLAFEIRENPAGPGTSHFVTIDIKELRLALPRLSEAIFCHVTPHERDKFVTDLLARTVASATTSFSSPRREGGLYGL